MIIPLVNLKKMHSFLHKEITKSFIRILNSNNFLNDTSIKKMEKKFALMNKSKYCVAVSSGTTALSLALEASGINRGDEVITTTNSFFSTYESIFHVGAIPIIVDVSENDLNISEIEISKKISKKTKAIVPVHIYGKPCNMNVITEIAKKNNLLIIEDCAQSHFAEYNNIPVGNFSKASAYSFYPGKNLGAMGDAGCIITNDKKVYKKILSLKDHGRVSKYNHQYVGYNYRIDSIQASIIYIKLRYIKKWNKIRNDLALIYINEFKYFAHVKLLDYNPKNIKMFFIFL